MLRARSARSVVILGLHLPRKIRLTDHAARP
jgi:hypothetical protein